MKMFECKVSLLTLEQQTMLAKYSVGGKNEPNLDQGREFIAPKAR